MNFWVFLSQDKLYVSRSKQDRLGQRVIDELQTIYLANTGKALASRLKKAKISSKKQAVDFSGDQYESEELPSEAPFGYVVDLDKKELDVYLNGRYTTSYGWHELPTWSSGQYEGLPRPVGLSIMRNYLSTELILSLTEEIQTYDPTTDKFPPGLSHLVIHLRQEGFSVNNCEIFYSDTPAERGLYVALGIFHVQLDSDDWLEVRPGQLLILTGKARRAGYMLHNPLNNPVLTFY